MIPLRLNLLPPEKKKYLQRMIFSEFTKSTLESILFLLCIASIALLLGRSVLEGYFNELTTNMIAASNQNIKSNQEIKEINRSLHQVKQVQDEYFLWSPVLADITNSLPNGVTLTSAYFNAGKKNISLVGSANLRADLLALEDALRSLPFISGVNVPLSQLTEKSNISFSLTAQIK